MIFKPFSSLCNTLILNKIIFNILTKSHRFIRLIFRPSEKHPSNAHSQYLFFYIFPNVLSKSRKTFKIHQAYTNSIVFKQKQAGAVTGLFLFEIVCNSIKPLFAFGAGFEAFVQPEILFGIFPCPCFDKVVHALGVGCNVV